MKNLNAPKLNEIKVMVNDLEEFLTKLNYFNVENYPNEQSEESQALENVFLEIREQKEALEEFLKEAIAE